MAGTRSSLTRLAVLLLLSVLSAAHWCSRANWLLTALLSPSCHCHSALLEKYEGDDAKINSEILNCCSDKLEKGKSFYLEIPVSPVFLENEG